MAHRVRDWFRARGIDAFAARCIAVGMILVIVACTCFGKLIQVQLLDGQATAEAATNSRTSKVVVSAKRGRILASNGTVLAQSVERYNIIGVPDAATSFTPVDCGTKQAKALGYCHSIDGKPVGVSGAAAVARLLAPLLDMDAMELGADLNGTNQYVILKKDVTPQVKRAIDKLNLGGIVYGELSSQRVYAENTLIGALLGGVNDDGSGASGLELTLNKQLSGTDGYTVYQRGNGGEVIPGTVSKTKAAQDGSDVTLTIDSDVDWYVKRVLAEGVASSHAKWGIAVVEDALTGEILALEDSDAIQAGSSEAKASASRAVSQTFEPGSIGKVPALAAILQNGVHKIDDHFTVPYEYTSEGQKFHDAIYHPDKRWTLAGILQNSSNSGMVMAAEKLTSQQRYDMLTKFGIGQATGLNLPGESRGVLGTPSSWDGRTKNTVLFGQGYTVNALQLSRVVSVIANKGVNRQQSLIKSVTDKNGKPVDMLNRSAARVLDEKIANQVRNAMESALEEYKGVAGVNGYRVAVKSGTAEVVGSDGSLSSIIADFAGIIPANDPRFIVTVVMQDPDGSYGGTTSGKLFAKIGEFLMQKYDVPNSPARTDAIPVEW
ncbi:peptidoglycan D,D-transpeptidase FtsI family protein [Bifidobacterium angulatum]|uniref:Penicillin-binding protein, transpeptidase domain protein n=1 Tax=Bifidobacterium angulatum DSM 20098 = JCM 7096 TaxID=518635 RepID=C4FE35_9BIFI|nr:penicillin-binding protein 2 [Bifidobacterium angulatum]EEP21216.1 penicillin-binding protein, transpeptidase domain protein [Bifidobacterium angulatum DSM 20098 = JCM 7096]KFI38780.1 peptidoglycan synthetase FtsI [Bifidobacterium angulatum]BAQ96125.1 peptidoglycan synthase [Bifidobacterium angulatum DSM 20098 = JCM 7096]